MLNRPVPLWTVACLLVLLDGVYQWGLRDLPWPQALCHALLEGIPAALVLWCVLRLDLARVTLCFLALPYVFFIPGWLNLPAALLLSLLLATCFWRVLRDIRSTRESHITPGNVLAFLLILAWVNFSGAGGYGHQVSDWEMHNARLHDLVERSWPIRYGIDQNLVYYLGYFLPSAALGKLTSFEIGLRSLFVWTTLGVTLAVRWLSVLSRWRLNAALVVAFTVFGPLDLLNLMLMNLTTGHSLRDEISYALHNGDHLDFRSQHGLGFFIGNYLSNTFQLFWSPQQIIAGWLGMALLTHLFLVRRFSAVVFVYALLCLWAPLAMLALLPFLLLTLLQGLRQDWRTGFSFANTLGAGVLALVFMVFYSGGSGDKNLSFWIFERANMLHHYLFLLVFLLYAWGIYLWLATSAATQEDRPWRHWFLCLAVALVVLPVYVFGDYSDLLCRGSAPLMFLLLIFVLRAIRHYYHQSQYWRVALIALCLLAGSVSAILRMHTAWQYYGLQQPVRSVIDYNNAFPNLGPDDSLFNRWLRKPLSQDP